MAHDVFISYCSADKPTGDAVCAALEGRGIRCWMAPRDILPGRDWGEAIVDGIEGAKVFVLVFSRKADASQQVKREVERAVNRGLVIIPMRIEDVLPGRQLEYFLGTPHWLDALTAPLEAHLVYLGETVQVFLDRGEAPPPRAPVSPNRLARLSPRQIVFGAAAAVGAILFVAFLVSQSGAGANGTTTGALGADGASTAIDAKFVGSWALVANPAEGPDRWSATFRKDRTYEGEVFFEEKGTILRNDESPLSEPIGKPTGRNSIQPFLTPELGPGGVRPGLYTPNGKQVNASGILPVDFFAFASAGNGNNAAALSTVTFDVVSDTEWKAALNVGKITWDVTFSTVGTKYTFRATHTESGTYEANGGKSRTVSDTGNVIDGTYSFQPDGSLVTKNDTGSGVWKKAR